MSAGSLERMYRERLAGKTSFLYKSPERDRMDVVNALFGVLCGIL